MFGLPEPFDRYEIRSRLGKGGMGAVYLAFDTTLGREVAIKIPKDDLRDDPDYRERFRREAQLASDLHHGNICPIRGYGVVEAGGESIPFLAMRLVRGESLAERLKREKSLGSREAVELVLKVAWAIDYAHKLGVIHRDLKPANIMIGEHGEPIVMDLGLARSSLADPGGRNLSYTGQALGTPAYMPREQFEGIRRDEGDRKAVNHRADVYSLGVVLYELLTGELPYIGTLYEVLEQLFDSNPPPSPRAKAAGVNEELERAIVKAMAKDRDDRFVTVARFAEALDAYLNGRSQFVSVSTIAAPPKQKASFFNSIGLKFAHIKPGSFLMGSTDAQIAQVLRLHPDANRNWLKRETPQHRVEITRPFDLAIHQVTVGQFRRFVDVPSTEPTPRRATVTTRAKSTSGGSKIMGTPGATPDFHRPTSTRSSRSVTTMPWPSAPGSASTTAGPIACRPRPSGNTPAAPARPRTIRTAATTPSGWSRSPTWPTPPRSESSRGGLASRPTAATSTRRLSGRSVPTPGVCTTRSVTSGSGAPIGSTQTTTRIRRPATRPGPSPTACAA